MGHDNERSVLLSGCRLSRRPGAKNVDEFVLASKLARRNSRPSLLLRLGLPCDSAVSFVALVLLRGDIACLLPYYADIVHDIPSDGTLSMDVPRMSLCAPFVVNINGISQEACSPHYCRHLFVAWGSGYLCSRWPFRCHRVPPCRGALAAYFSHHTRNAFAESLSPPRKFVFTLWAHILEATHGNTHRMRHAGHLAAMVSDVMNTARVCGVTKSASQQYRQVRQKKGWIAMPPNLGDRGRSIRYNLLYGR